MKQYKYSLLIAGILSFFSLSVYGQTGTITCDTVSSGTLSKTWSIDVKEATKAVRITYAIDITFNNDNVVFFGVNSSGQPQYSGVAPTGYCTGTYITSTKTGKAQILLSCNTAGMKHIKIQYCADNPLVTNSDLNVGGNALISGSSTVSGNSIVSGNLGVGVTSSTKKVEIWDAGTSRFSFSGTNCTSGYEIANTIDNTGYKINVSSGIRDFRVAIAGTDKFIIGSTGTIDLVGTVTAGTTNKIKLMDWTNQGSWIDIPVVSGKASGIGSGGIGVNAWVAYAGVAQQWFSNSSAGDICYRNTGGRLLFGNTGGNAAMSMYNNNIGIGTVTPTATLDVLGTNNTTAAARFINLGSGSQNSKGIVVQAGANTSASFIADFQNYSGASQLYVRGDGNIGVGTTAPDYKLTVNGNFEVKNGANYLYYDGAADFVMKCDLRGAGGRAIVHDGGNILTLNYGNDFNGGTKIGNNVFFQEGGISYINTGKLAIGLPDAATKLATSPADELFTVNGTIHAKEVKVDLTGSLADYVFDANYNLKPLNEVEQYIKTNKHLAEMPSADTVSKNGLSMGEMQNKLLQKVEELTLYVIEQQKQIEELKKNQK